MTTVSSKDFVWAKEGLREIDQVIDVNITELFSGPVSNILRHIVFELVTRGLWSMENVYMIDSNDTVPISRRFVVLYFQSVPVIFLFSLFLFQHEKTVSSKLYPRVYPNTKVNGDFEVLQIFFYLKYNFCGSKSYLFLATARS